MNDAFFYLGVLIFFFILWVYSGGPTHPLSFAGPYITPITDVGVEQVGYGDSLSSTTRAYFGTYSGIGTGTRSSGTSALPRDVLSPRNGTVSFDSLNPQGSSASTEYIGVRNNGNVEVDVTDWQIVDAGNGNSIRIPFGSRNQNVSPQRVVLSSGQSVVIATGSRENSNSTSYYGNWNSYLNLSRDIWNDRNDTLTLLDKNGKVVDQYRY